MDSCGAMAHRAVLLKELGLAQRGAAAKLRVVVIAKHLWLMRGTLSWKRTARGCTQ
jgi:ribosome-associated protein YbcJ (S4-like RNA binding protein)